MRTNYKYIVALLFLFAMSGTVKAQEHAGCHGHAEGADATKPHDHQDIKLGGMTIPNAQLINQKGEKVRFSELIEGKVVAMNFIFTTCTTICPPMGANFTHLKGLMADKVESGELVMLSVSIDPVTDTPARLQEWSNKFSPGEGWTLLTGKKAEVDGLLKALKVFTPLKEEHAPILLMGKQGTDDWIRTNGLAKPTQLKEALDGYFTPATGAVEADATEDINHEREYFTNVVLVNQYGEEMRLYDDLMKDKVVVVTPFFLRCKGSCPVMSAMMRDLQNHYGDKVGKEIHLISISVDPAYDTPKRVKAYAKKMEAKRGWYLLTGTQENVDKALFKLGNGVSEPSDHKNVLMIGNVPTRLWKKANGLAPPNEIAAIVDSVLRDEE